MPILFPVVMPVITPITISVVIPVTVSVFIPVAIVTGTAGSAPFIAVASVATQRRIPVGWIDAMAGGACGYIKAYFLMRPCGIVPAEWMLSA